MRSAFAARPYHQDDSGWCGRRRSAHDAHLDAALSDYDKEFTALQLESGRLAGGSMASGRLRSG